MSPATKISLVTLLIASVGGLASCGGGEKAEAKNPVVPAGQEVSVGVVKVGTMTLQRQLTQSSELVPFQQIDVYAKESGYVKDLKVDYGTHVKAGELLATLEIPELQMQLRQDDAAIRNAGDMVTHAQRQLGRVEAQHNVLHLEFDRLNKVSQAKPGLVAQQEVDDAQGKDLASEAQIEAGKATLESSQSLLAQAQAKREHDQVLFDYSKITAPFAGVVTQRYANLGTLVQGGTTGINALPIVQLAEDDKFRLVIPIPESYVRYIRIGDPAQVSVPSLDRTFPGQVARFSMDVKEDTRTMHTEVDVANRNGALMPGLYADATITLQRENNAVAVPLQAVNRTNDRATVYVVGASNKIEEREVKLGIQTATDAEVLSGLQAGESIVVSDRSGLKPGEVVRPQAIQLLQYQSGTDK